MKFDFKIEPLPGGKNWWNFHTNIAIFQTAPNNKQDSAHRSIPVSLKTCLLQAWCNPWEGMIC